jgi:Fe-S oxidoreductase
MAKQYYVLFYEHMTGMALYNMLKEQGIKTVIAPAPRSLSACCGISLLVGERDVETIRSFVQVHELRIADIASVENGYDKFRDKFC